MVITGENVQDGVTTVTGPNPPTYLQLLNESDGAFNEPDGGVYGPPKYTPQEAYNILTPILAAKTKTIFLSPAPAYPTSTWLKDFFSICKCEDRFPIILAHIYDVDSNAAISAVKNVMGQFPGKTIWITEISPASSTCQNCNLTPAGMISWMNQVIGCASQHSIIDRVL